MSISNNTVPYYAALPHVLVVDDDARIRDLVSRYLTEHGFIAATAGDAAEAREILKTFAFDAMIVDVMMPGETGLEFTRDFRKNFTIPVLLLTALGEAGDRIAGLESGADDYLPKPFEPRELLLRLRAILRRTAPKQDFQKPFAIGRWVFDPVNDEISDGDELRKLTESEGVLLRALAAGNGEAVSREALAQACGLDFDGRAIDVQITRLRKKLGEGKIPRLVLTARGRGYLIRTGGIHAE
jgi:two-component system phosphate regulon response regulator OmpR